MRHFAPTLCEIVIDTETNLMAGSSQIFLVMDEGSPVAAFTARPELKAYLLRPLDAFINPGQSRDAEHHDPVGGAGRVVGARDAGSHAP